MKHGEGVVQARVKFVIEAQSFERAAKILKHTAELAAVFGNDFLWPTLYKKQPKPQLAAMQVTIELRLPGKVDRHKSRSILANLDHRLVRFLVLALSSSAFAAPKHFLATAMISFNTSGKSSSFSATVEFFASLPF